MLPRNGRQGVDPVRTLVEAGQKVEFLPSRVDKGSPALDSQLLECFQAVGDEARADHVDAAHAALTVLGERRRGIGLEPGGAAEARLEGDLPPAFGEA